MNLTKADEVAVITPTVEPTIKNKTSKSSVCTLFRYHNAYQ